MVIIFCGALLGLLMAQASLDSEFGFNRIKLGPWIGNARRGGVAADPYTRAALVRSGELPLGGGEGLTFVADADSTGKNLDPNCTYIIKGETPPARFWTVTASTKDGLLLANPANRFGYTSSEVTRAADGSFQLMVSRLPFPGQWLPVSAAPSLRLTLRLYDTPLANETGGIVPVWPDIVQVRC